MTIHFESGYSLPSGDASLENARILHNGNALSWASETDDVASDWTTYEKWEPGEAPATWTGTASAASECDCCCIGAHNLSGTTVTLSCDGTEIMSITPEDNSPIMMLFAPVTGTAWSLTVSSATASVAIIKIGKALQMEEPITGAPQPLKYSRETTYQANSSATGEWLGRTIQRSALSGGFSWEYLSPEWVEANWPDAQAAFEAAPFFIAWFPDEVDEVGLCYTTGAASCAYMGSGRFMTASISVTGYAHD